MRDHVVPELVDAGVLHLGERVEVSGPHAGQLHRSTSPTAKSPPPGVAVLRTGVVRTEVHEGGSDVTLDSGRPFPDGEPELPAPAPPQVHVHIDRIEVVRAASHPTPPAPPRRDPPRVDHAAYLERRRADRR